MTKDDIISMAQVAGFVVDEQSRQMQPNCISHTWHVIDEGLARFAALVAAAEREAIIDIIEEYRISLPVLGELKADIRARGERND